MSKKPASFATATEAGTSAIPMDVILRDTTGAYVAAGGGGGGGDASAANQTTEIAALGAPADAEATGSGSIIAILKRLRTLLNGGLPAALGAGGGVKVDGSGTALPVSGTITANAGTGTLGTNLAQVAGTTTDTNSGTKSAGTQRVVLATDQPQLTNALKVDGSAVTQPVSGAVTVGGYTVLSAVDFTRPADTTAYAVSDAIADSTSAPTVLTFANCARSSGGSGYVTRARVMTDQSANVAAYRLHLFRATVTAINDNAALTTLIANRSNYLGYIDLPTAGTEGSGSDAANTQNLDTRLAFVATGTSLFGLLQTKTAFTPASGQRFYVELGIEQN